MAVTTADASRVGRRVAPPRAGAGGPLAADRVPGARRPGDLAVWTNIASRTIASGYALAAGLAPGCPMAVGHLAVGRTDPLFDSLPTGLASFDGAAAIVAVDRYTSGLPALTARHAGALRLLARVIGCDWATPRCDLAADPGRIDVAAGGRDLAVTGAIRRASGTAQVLLLQYLEGMVA